MKYKLKMQALLSYFSLQGVGTVTGKLLDVDPSVKARIIILFVTFFLRFSSLFCLQHVRQFLQVFGQ